MYVGFGLDGCMYKSGTFAEALIFNGLNSLARLPVHRFDSDVTPLMMNSASSKRLIVSLVSHGLID